MDAIILRCGTDTYSVDKSKLRTQSSIFASCFLQHKNWSLAEIDVSMEHPELVRCLVEFLDTSKYKTPPPRERCWDAYKKVHDILDALDHHVQVRRFAQDKLMWPFEKYAMMKFRKIGRGCKGWYLRRIIGSILKKASDLTGSLDQERLRSILKDPLDHRLPEIQFVLTKLRRLVSVPSEVCRLTASATLECS